MGKDFARCERSCYTLLFRHPVVNGTLEKPLGIVLTEYHMLILYDDRVVAICTMNEQIAYEDVLGKVCTSPYSVDACFQFYRLSEIWTSNRHHARSYFWHHLGLHVQLGSAIQDE